MTDKNVTSAPKVSEQNNFEEEGMIEGEEINCSDGVEENSNSNIIQ